jgi:hypothetical protein
MFVRKSGYTAKNHLMHRRVFLCVLACAVGFAGAGAASASASTSIELLDGSGRAVLNLRGAVLGGFESGRITVTRHVGVDRVVVIVSGADWMEVVNERTTIYGGSEIRFRVFHGSWRVRIQGSGIDATAVGRGTVGLAGRGQYSLAGKRPFLPWPVEYQTIKLALEDR